MQRNAVDANIVAGQVRVIYEQATPASIISLVVAGLVCLILRDAAATYVAICLVLLPSTAWFVAQDSVILRSMAAGGAVYVAAAIRAVPLWPRSTC